jgi:hypothetical protein
MDDCPAVTDAGLAVMLTVGAVVVVSPGPMVPHPASSRSSEKLMNIASGERSERKALEPRTFFMLKSFLCPG